MADPFGRAILDHHRGEREQPLLQRDGEETLKHPIEEFYFGEGDADRLRSTFDGPVLDMGAGAGRDALALQEYAEVVAIEVSEHLVRTMEERGVGDARRGDMFALREGFDRDRFRSAYAVGTQLGLVGSMRGLREFLGDLAYVTTPDATAVLDNYDPAFEGTRDLLGYRDDPAPGLAHRVMWFEYEDAVGDVLHFRLFGPDRVREAAAGTGWRVADVDRGDDYRYHYRVRLEKV